MLQAALLLLLAPQSPTTGLVEIPAGRTLVGGDLKDYKKLMASKPGVAQQLGADTPRSQVDVASFAIAPTEVTNEMYSRYVEATGAQPPVTWLVISKEERNAIIQEMQKEDPSWIFEGLKKSKWWDEHWQDEGMKWEMAPEIATSPVVGISHDDAREYCKWAGLRLPTEEEWVRAARGDSDQSWPYGDEFDRKLVACTMTQPRNLSFKLLPVNSMPENSSSYGIVDLCGNAWEWTDSRFNPLPGFKSFKIKGKDGKPITILPPFDGSAPVIRGGAFNMPDYGTSVDRRHGIFNIARLEFVGFRVASSLNACTNALLYATDVIDARILGATVEEGLDFSATIGLEKRQFADLDSIAAARKAPEQGLPNPTPPEAYAIFDGYSCIGLTPVKAINESSIAKLSKNTTREGPIPVGVLHSTVPLSEPNLVPGTWILSYQGELKAAEITKTGARSTEGEVPPEGFEAPENWPDYSDLTLAPKTEYIIFVAPDSNRALAAIPLSSKAGMGTAKKAPHKMIINKDRGSIDFEFRALDQRGRKAFTFRLPVKPISKGADLISETAWDGSNFEIKEPVPEEG
ncbi:MAG: SUMF1/EgtB/PvdO family nonheme iron enzyme [Planctomycetota bacterium]|nr:SUMF1/EgtB/PvdO family nonheme iron enzyme [Planctomycetota bacterium]MDP7245378.1 SUMF1/EgtB/PvdO family nonheme iron enzyme [Planctomycetota bacterium]|tara:strand:+ start:1742 stop:3460 length:1719 start_codon:yes stop_codon:yes gene_type:complete